MTKPQVTTQMAHSRMRGVWHAGVDMSPFVHPGGEPAQPTAEEAPA